MILSSSYQRSKGITWTGYTLTSHYLSEDSFQYCWVDWNSLTSYGSRS